MEKGDPGASALLPEPSEWPGESFATIVLCSFRRAAAMGRRPVCAVRSLEQNAFAMARFFFVSIPAAGHVHPTLPIVHALMERGHEVGYASGPTLEQTVAPLVTRFFPAGPAMTADEALTRWPEMGRLRGKQGLDFMAREVMFPFAATAAREVLDAMTSWQPDVLVFDSFTHLASIVADASGLPWATTTVIPGLMESKGAHPFGIGLPYPPSLLQRFATPLFWLLLRMAARGHDRQFNAIRAEFGLPPVRDGFLQSTRSPFLVLALMPQEFEYPRRAWPPHVHFVGPCLWDRPPDYAVPDWLETLPGERPLVYATIGTVQSIYQAEFFGTLFDAARSLDADVVVTTGGNPSDLPAPPGNVRVERYVPNSIIIPKAQVVVHHGGASSTIGAMVHGKPAVVAPFAHDQPDNAQRVRWLGVGTMVDPITVSSTALEGAIEAALASSAMHDRAAALSRQLRQYDAGQTAAELLEELAKAQAPVYRIRTRHTKP